MSAEERQRGVDRAERIELAETLATERIDRADVLAKIAATLAEKVEANSTAIEHVATQQAAAFERQHKGERRVWITLGAAIFDILLTIAMCGLFWFQYHTNQALEDTRSQVLCPLYKVFLGSYNPKTRAPGFDREQYDQAFVVIRNSYQVLDCSGPLVPPPIPHASPPSSPPTPPS